MPSWSNTELGRYRLAVMRRNVLAALTLSLVLMTSACIEDDTEVARDPVRIPDVNPTAIAALPGGIEVAQVSITDGSFSVEEVVLQQLEPTIIEVTNHDDRAYRLEIADLVSPAEIAPNTLTQVEFTTPDDGLFTGALLAADNDEVLDTVFVAVQDEGATGP